MSDSDSVDNSGWNNKLVDLTSRTAVDVYPASANVVVARDPKKALNSRAAAHPLSHRLADCPVALWCGGRLVTVGDAGKYVMWRKLKLDRGEITRNGDHTLIKYWMWDGTDADMPQVCFAAEQFEDTDTSTTHEDIWLTAAQEMELVMEKGVLMWRRLRDERFIGFE